MAPGISLYEVEGSDTYTIHFYYQYEDENGQIQEASIERDAIPTSNPYKFVAKSTSGSTELTQSMTGNELKLSGENLVITKNSDLVGEAGYIQRQNVGIFKEFEVKDLDNGTTEIKVEFDEPALRAWKYDMKAAGTEVLGFRMVYYAILDADAKINSNENSNVAYVYYEKDSTGTSTTEMHDTVYAYTYGLNIIKIDGSASERAYLAGAQFKLYKELTGDITEEQKTEYGSDHENYYVLPGENEASDRYFKKVVINNGVFTQGSTGDYDTLISVGNEKGITAHGLADGKYVLVETKAPSGYNELAEDIYFEINRLNENEEQLKTTDKSLIWFRELSEDYDENNAETAVINQNACISIDVYNYQGLTLPSTGGIGILIFVIIGMILMGSVIIIMVGRRRMQDTF